MVASLISLINVVAPIISTPSRKSSFFRSLFSNASSQTYILPPRFRTPSYSSKRFGRPFPSIFSMTPLTIAGAPPGQKKMMSSSPDATAEDPRMKGGKMFLGSVPLTVIATFDIHNLQKLLLSKHLECLQDKAYAIRHLTKKSLVA